VVARNKICLAPKNQITKQVKELVLTALDFSEKRSHVQLTNSSWFTFSAMYVATGRHRDT